MGATIENTSEWAIVGGTGEFAMARGVIERKTPVGITGGVMQELAINGYCFMKVANIHLHFVSMHFLSTHSSRPISFNCMFSEQPTHYHKDWTMGWEWKIQTCHSR